MKLSNHLMLWLAFSSLLPLILMMTALNHYNQRVFIASVDEEMQAELARLSSTIERQMSLQRDLLHSLADSPMMQEFGDAFNEVVSTGSVTKEFTQTKKRLASFLTDLQPLIAENAVIRILDQGGNTVIKARFGFATPPNFEGLAPYPLMEAEPDAQLVRSLKNLPTATIKYMRFPGSADDYRPLNALPLLDAVRPLEVKKQRFFIIYSSVGQRMDRRLSLAPRLRGSSLSITAFEQGHDPELYSLYNDGLKLAFSSATPLRPPAPSILSDNWKGRAEGIFDSKSGQQRFYFTEFHPYPDEFYSWIISSTLDHERITSQFRLMRLGLAGLAILVLLLTLFFAKLASLRLAKPIIALAHNLRDYALGKPVAPDIPTLSSEVTELQQAFHSMTQTLEQAKAQRAKAEKQLLQSSKLASIGEMAAGIGHELNNPLNNIISLGKLIKRGNEEKPELIKDVDALLDETRRASVIVSGILNFARQITPDYQRFKVLPWLRTCLSRVQRVADEKHLKVKLGGLESLSLEADPFQLEQVIVNLLRNAFQASDLGGTVKIDADDDGDELCLCIIDQGSGLDVDSEKHLFEPFYTTKKVGEGSGLGLSISLGIVETHAGTLSLHNNKAGGCTAEIHLPLRSFSQQEAT
jgi:two-component system NtrC family sensor kinase